MISGALADNKVVTADRINESKDNDEVWRQSKRERETDPTDTQNTGRERTVMIETGLGLRCLCDT